VQATLGIRRETQAGDQIWHVYQTERWLDQGSEGVHRECVGWEWGQEGEEIVTKNCCW
jgi:hypothetical protein